MCRWARRRRRTSSRCPSTARQPRWPGRSGGSSIATASPRSGSGRPTLLAPLVPDAIAAAVVAAGGGAAPARATGSAWRSPRPVTSLEERFGLETLELPVGELVQVADGDGLHRLAVGPRPSAPRRLQRSRSPPIGGPRGVRGRGRPMPDLATHHDAVGEWLEVPWWLWSQEDPRRRRVFANTATPGVLALSDLETVRVELPIAAGHLALEMDRRPLPDGGARGPAAAPGGDHDAPGAASGGRCLRARHRRSGLRHDHRRHRPATDRLRPAAACHGLRHASAAAGAGLSGNRIGRS